MKVSCAFEWWVPERLPCVISIPLHCSRLTLHTFNLELTSEERRWNDCKEEQRRYIIIRKKGYKSFLPNFEFRLVDSLMRYASLCCDHTHRLTPIPLAFRTGFNGTWCNSLDVSERSHTSAHRVHILLWIFPNGWVCLVAHQWVFPNAARGCRPIERKLTEHNLRNQHDESQPLRLFFYGFCTLNAKMLAARQIVMR